MRSVFEFKDYKAYLRAIENSGTERAFRTRLAKAAGCQNAYVSQVLNGDLHFSLEQGDGLCEMLKHSIEEKEYFFLLLQHARAGKPSLRKFFGDQIAKSTARRLALKNRVHTGEELSDQDRNTYYSDWFYSAIHVLVTIARFQTVETIAERLQLPLTTTKQAASFLVACGLLDEKNGRLSTGKARLFLPSDSPLIGRHHANWRMRTLQALPRSSSEEMHYSSVVTISEADAEVLREHLIQAIQKAKQVIRDSKEEDIFCFNVDFFRL